MTCWRPAVRFGSGEPGFDNIGYWLYPETQPSEKATHVEGTVGACHGIEKDSAGTKFYISLSKAPFNDTHYTIFGQVTRGLDVAKKIFAEPICEEDMAATGGRGRFALLRPDHPVMMQKVIIHTDGDGAEDKKYAVIYKGRAPSVSHGPRRARVRGPTQRGSVNLVRPEGAAINMDPSAVEYPLTALRRGSLR